MATGLPKLVATLTPVLWYPSLLPYHFLGVSAAPESSIVMPDSVVKPVSAPQVVQSSRRKSSRGRYTLNSLVGCWAVLVWESLGAPKTGIGLPGPCEIKLHSYSLELQLPELEPPSTLAPGLPALGRRKQRLRLSVFQQEVNQELPLSQGET